MVTPPPFPLLRSLSSLSSSHLSSPPTPSLSFPPLPPLPSSHIRTSQCLKSGSVVWPKSHLLRPTPQSPYRPSRYLPTLWGKGRGRSHPHSKGAEARVGHLDEGETLQKYLIRNKYSIPIAVPEEGPFTVRSTYVRTYTHVCLYACCTNCSSAVYESTSELETPLYEGQTTVASYPVPISILTFV